MRFKKVMRYDDRFAMLRIGRFLFRPRADWGGHYSAKLSLAVWPKLFKFERGFHEWDVTFLGVRFHYLGTGGGMV